jgi:TonB family protein
MRNLQVIASTILAFFILVAVARSQENSAPQSGVPPELATLTGQVIRKVPETDRSGVLVLGLKGPDEASPFGEWLADQLSLALAKSDNTLEIIDRAKLAVALDTRHLSRNDMFDARNAEDVAAGLGAHTVVIGTFGAAENGIGVTLSVRTVARLGETVPFSALVLGKIPLTGAVASNLGVPLASLRPKDGIFTPGAAGVRPPLCLSCPRADIPTSAIPPHNVAVQLMALVTAEGNVENVAVVKGLGAPFDAAAVNAVRRWKLKPAVDIDGNPVPVRQLISVAFEL